MEPFVARITPLEGPGAGAGGPGDPHPSHPIVIPPDAIAPGVPTHPIVLPPFPTDPVDPGYGIDVDEGYKPPPRPTHPIVYPPGLPDQGLPPTPGLPPLIPTHPIVVPKLPTGSVVAIPLPQDKMPSKGPAGTVPYLVFYGGNKMPAVAWIPVPASPKK